MTIRHLDYRGWHDSLLLSNGKAEAVIVPAIGRIMQFRSAGEEGPFWENPAMEGKAPDPSAAVWGNFGGDKTWPAPEQDWRSITGREFPPPPAFDSMPVSADVRGSAVVLVSPLDRSYGMRTQRRIELDPVLQAMHVTTVYEKQQGSPVKVAVWIITQLKDPVAVFAPLPEASTESEPYHRLSEASPDGVTIQKGLLSLIRSPAFNTKIGCNAGTLLWIGETQALRIDSPRVPGAQYPDKGSSAEVYTNRDPLAYVELEMLGPLATMRPGERIEQTNTYTLIRRTERDAFSEALKILSPSNNYRKDVQDRLRRRSP